jgi:phenylpropionate dioxygenase-like ring-hydroxylating dioxygenase large terminal subunit
VLLLGEKLLAFRTTSGKVGLIQSACGHRGASLFFGRNEEEGIRCVYHGWKFDRHGTCVDMPTESPEVRFKGKVKIKSYPCVERGGVVWAYMGPRAIPPALPDIEPNMLPGAEKYLVVRQVECNWLQTIENNMDTAHLAFLHWGSIDKGGPSTLPDYMIRNRSVKFHVIDTPSGASGAGYRPAEEDGKYDYRIANYHFPFFTQSPTANFDTSAKFVAVVPMDDTHTMTWAMYTSKYTAQEPMAVLPNTTDWLGRFRPAVRLEDDLQIDREVQKTDRTTLRGFSGIPTLQIQDRGITESQGKIQDHSIENLGATDAMIVRVRRLLLSAAKRLEEGVTPPGVESPEQYRRRSGSIVLPRDVDVWEATKELREQSFNPEKLLAATNS